MNLPDAISHLKKDPALQGILDKVAVPDFTPSGKVYYDLLESIVSQQLSTKVATVIFNRLLALFPDGYPHPQQLIDIESDRLRSVGLSNQKASYLQNVARFSLENDLENHAWHTLSDAEVIAFLTKIKGVGQWTVEMILMFTLGRPDVFPIDDLGIQQAMTRLYQLEESGKNLKKRMLELAQPWQPYRTVASRFLWRWKDAQ